MPVVATPRDHRPAGCKYSSVKRKNKSAAIVRWLSKVPSRLPRRIERLFPDHAGMIYTVIFGSRIDGIASQTKQHFWGGIDPSFGGVRCPNGLGVHDHHAIGACSGLPKVVIILLVLAQSFIA